MKVSALLLILMLSIVAGAVAYVLVYFYVPRELPGMGKGVGPQLYVWIPVVIVPASFIVGYVAYLALLPEFREKPPRENGLPEDQKSLAAVMRVLKDDERKVIELLISGGGKMLQRDIGRKAGFSRVKTHRVLYRLSARGIVNAKKYYNTYEIELADWLR